MSEKETSCGATEIRERWSEAIRRERDDEAAACTRIAEQIAEAREGEARECANLAAEYGNQPNYYSAGGLFAQGWQAASSRIAEAIRSRVRQDASITGRIPREFDFSDETMGEGGDIKADVVSTEGSAEELATTYRTVEELATALEISPEDLVTAGQEHQCRGKSTSNSKYSSRLSTKGGSEIEERKPAQKLPKRQRKTRSPSKTAPTLPESLLDASEPALDAVQRKREATKKWKAEHADQVREKQREYMRRKRAEKRDARKEDEK